MLEFWHKFVGFSCEDCGYEMTSVDYDKVKREFSEEIETEMDFFTCPQCGKRAIVLW